MMMICFLHADVMDVPCRASKATIQAHTPDSTLLFKLKTNNVVRQAMKLNTIFHKKMDKEKTLFNMHQNPGDTKAYVMKIYMYRAFVC